MLVDLLTVFASAFLAATLLPFYSEVVVTAQVYRYPDELLLIWLVASLGNTLGAVVNYWMGAYILHFQDRKWFPIKANQMATAQRWFQRYGIWSLLLAWAPVGGDALALIAGTMRVKITSFLILVFVGKAARYAVVIYFAEKIITEIS